jgi:predicted AAA+ superfamily ATPase
VEVDFVLRLGDALIAIEAKASPRMSTSHLQGLRAIAELPGVVRRILVYGGSRRLTTAEGIEVWPIADLSAELGAGGLWP